MPVQDVIDRIFSGRPIPKELEEFVTAAFERNKNSPPETAESWAIMVAADITEWGTIYDKEMSGNCPPCPGDL